MKPRRRGSLWFIVEATGKPVRGQEHETEST
jgi:hypothetical protein